MRPEREVLFGSFRLDPNNERLYAEDRVIPLRPKTFRILKHLVDRAGQLVTKDELLDAVWADITVGDAVLKGCIREIRDALDDTRTRSRFIETRHRRGYRFIAPVIESRGHQVAESRVTIGRRRERALLHGWLEQSLRGERQVVFVTGEPGIGKTTLVDAFVAEIAASTEIRVGRGQCLEHFGAGEPYLPMLEAMGRLCREPGGPRLVAVLRKHAPTWLAQMPALVPEADLEALQRQVVGGGTPQRMLREMADALEALTIDTPLVLVLEDLHWCDVSTLDLLASLAERREPARLLVIGTYRPADIAIGRHPLGSVKLELQMHRRCVELPLAELSEPDVAAYLDARFAGHQFPRDLPHVIHQRTDGHPLFMVSVLDDLVTTEAVVSGSLGWELTVTPTDVAVRVPESVRQMIERRIERLSTEERGVLEAASVAGVEFSTVAIATVLDQDPVGVERWCEELVRRHQFIQRLTPGELPDGVTTRYTFKHALHRDVLYEQVPATRRAWLHREVGCAFERLHADCADELAAELAVHFEQGRDVERAVKYLQQAAANAARRFANHEVVGLAQRGLTVLRSVRNRTERTREELALQMTLGTALIATRGYSAPEVEQVYARAQELCRASGDTPERFRVLWGLARFYLVRTALSTSRELGEELLRVAERANDRELRLQAHSSLGAALFHMGEFALAQHHFEEGIALYDHERRVPHLHEYVQDPGVVCLVRASLALWCLGHPDQALRRAHEALGLSRQLSHPFSAAFALSFTAMLHELRREWSKAREYASQARALSSQQGFSALTAMAELIDAGAATQQDVEAVPERRRIRETVNAAREIGIEMFCAYGLGMLARACGGAGQVDEACALVNEALALVQRSEERFYEAELHRLRGDALQQSTEPDAAERAEESFARALEVARRQQAGSWELRAATSLARLHRKQGQCGRARQVLANVYARFTEGLDTPDLQEARAVLEEISSAGSSGISIEWNT